jgi:hypothetical protein
VSWGGNLRPAENTSGVSENSTLDTNGVEPAAGAAVETATEPVTPPVGEEPEAFKVFLRLSEGERIEAGEFDGEADAHRFAEELMAAAATATIASKWPRIGDRYFRPETIISIDVERSDVPRWTGSTGRATSWTQR